ncbi:carbohydrate kinase [Cellulomonas hominis]|uniref:Carbohydrate kinase n=1 Tax=Cellulomonas hominis TaxID=156981 RepID=A0A7Z8K1V4_9CELL|nr:PfkB family carbohydrate kinase [Cellulomonas hominis]TKR26635.1 carbohydrate kinase [Cellulomonas hominis]
MGRFLMIGEALVDVVQAADGARTCHPGGSPANVALTTARLGDDTRLLTWIAPDELGAVVREHLTRAGVVVLPQSVGATRTSTAKALVDDTGAAHYEFDLEWTLAPAAVDPDTTVVHTGSIAALAPTSPPGALSALLAAAHERATITYDPNLRPTVMGPVDLVRGEVERLVARADVVKVSDEDLAWLYPGSDPHDVLGRWVGDHALAMGVLTRGAQGPSAILRSGERVDVPAPAVTVVDTIGAGDSFMGGLLHALDQDGLTGAGGRDRLAALTAGEARAVLAVAARVAAVTVSRAGANPPTLEELSA